MIPRIPKNRNPHKENGRNATTLSLSLVCKLIIDVACDFGDYIMKCECGDKKHYNIFDPSYIRKRTMEDTATTTTN